MFSNSYFGVGSGPLMMQVQWCLGDEPNLMSCTSTPLGSVPPSCDHTNEVGVSCQGNYLHFDVQCESFMYIPNLLVVRGNSCTDGAARIVNGNRNNTGRIEVCNYGIWGSVCDSNWNSTAAAVACVQSGLRNGLGIPIQHVVSLHLMNFNFRCNNLIAGAIPRFNAIYGPGKGPIWLPQLACTGDERSLFNCSYDPLETLQCSHFNDAGVECPSE